MLPPLRVPGRLSKLRVDRRRAVPGQLVVPFLVVLQLVHVIHVRHQHHASHRRRNLDAVEIRIFIRLLAGSSCAAESRPLIRRDFIGNFASRKAVVSQNPVSREVRP
jgi:hypothetical protein